MTKFYIFSMFLLGIVVFLFLSVKPSIAGESPVNMVPVGPICVDQFEASVWSKPPKVNGSPQGTQLGVTTDDYTTSAGCSNHGNDCTSIFAASVPGVPPSRIITWFQAQQACANVGKRLLTNAEWQMAAAGTLDPVLVGGVDNGATDCNIASLANDETTNGYPLGWMFSFVMIRQLEENL